MLFYPLFTPDAVRLGPSVLISTVPPFTLDASGCAAPDRTPKTNSRTTILSGDISTL